MAARYYTGSWTTQESLAAAVDTVLTGQSWTQDELDNTNDEAGWHLSNHFVSMDWDNSADINFYQATAWSGAGTAPGAHTGDSGSDLIVNDIGNAGVAYHAFTDDGDGGPLFVYFVIEFTAGFYRHFGFFQPLLHGGWSTDGASYGHRWSQLTSSIDVPNSAQHSVLFDGGHTLNGTAAVIKITGSEWPNPPSSCAWGAATSNASVGNDTAGNGRYRMQGGSRRGPYVQQYGFIDSSPSDAFVAGSPIPLIAKDETYDPEHWMWMGEMPSVYVGSMANYADEEIKDFGGEDWMVFPIVNSSWAANPDIEQSGNGGIWYRKT